MKVLNEHIKNEEFKKIYLLCGEEDYLIKQYRDKLKLALMKDTDDMNFSCFQGSKINPIEVCDTGDTLPFFADRRVIVIINSGYFKSAPEKFQDRMEFFPDTTHVIFVEHEVDKRSRLYKKIKEVGYVAEFNSLDTRTLGIWINSLCKEEGKSISTEAINYLIEYIGTDMNQLKLELEKLFSYTIDKKIVEREDIQQVCISQATSKIFDMLDAIGSRNQGKALSLYHDLLELREPPMRILFLLTRQYNILLQVRRCLDEGKDSSLIAPIVGVPPFTVKKYVAQGKIYSYGRLKKMLEECQETDYKIKTGQITDVIGVELLIVEFSR